MAEAPAFATATDLAARLGRDLTDLESDQAGHLLADASAHLRALIGWQVWPAVTVTTRIGSGVSRAELPGSPITAITSVAVGGASVPAGSYELVDGALWGRPLLPAGAVVTYIVGYPAAPRELASWACVLASQALSAVSELGALGGGGVSSVAIDDYRRTWSDGGSGAGFVLPPRVEQQLRERYGAGTAFVTGSR